MSYGAFAPLFVSLGTAALFALAFDPKVHWRLQSRRAAERKALALLRQWLTPEQLQPWDAGEEFDVIGADSGTRYRITRGTTMNIYQLGDAHAPVKRWCFAPVGKLAVGDVLLAQKIALENDECAALTLANS
jgi:hypothetical protein